MSNAPEKIWAGGREPEWFFDDPSDHRDGGYKEYTRTDIAQARIAELEATLKKAMGALGDIHDGVEQWPNKPKKELAWCRNLAGEVIQSTLSIAALKKTA
jgi:hypothetical protein